MRDVILSAGQSSRVRIIPSDRTDFNVTSTTLLGDNPIREVPLVDEGGLGWEDVSRLCPVQTILDLYTYDDDPQMMYASRGPLVSRLAHDELKKCIKYEWARLHRGSLVSRPGMFFVQQCYVHSVLQQRVDFRSVPAAGHGVHNQTRSLPRVALAPVDISIGDSSSAAPSLTQQVLPGAHVVLTSDDVAALASRVDDVLRTYRKAFETNSARVDLASTRASSSQSTLDDARAHLHTLEEHASEQRIRLMHRIHALEEQARRIRHICVDW